MSQKKHTPEQVINKLQEAQMAALEELQRTLQESQFPD